MAMASSPAFARSLWDQRELEYLLLAKDLKLVKSMDHAELSQLATELKRMLTALLQKLNALSRNFDR
jgi:hypothetical protein